MPPSYTANPTYCKARKPMQTSCELRNHVIRSPINSKRDTLIAARAHTVSRVWSGVNSSSGRANVVASLVVGGLRMRDKVRVAPST